MGQRRMAMPKLASWMFAAGLGLAACGDDGAEPPSSTDPNTMGGAGAAAGAGAGAAGQQSSTAGAAGMATPRAGQSGATPSRPPSGGSEAGAGAGATAGMSAPAGGAGSSGMAAPSGGGGAGGMTLPPVSGPVDGDPSKPMVTIPNVPCGAPNVSLSGPPAANMMKITNRDVFVSYPCAHEGAAVTFYLAIHGTLNEGQKIPFTLTNFPIHTKTDSDNFIVVAPQAIGTQWGNGDNGMDLPHLYEVIDWVYATFGEKFNIRGMWASGGSWGSAYLYNFACDPKLENRLTGIRMIVGRGCPPCSTRLSCIVGEQELEEGGGMPLSDPQKEMKIMAANVERYAMMHGCDARTGPTNLGPVRAWTWPNCDKGWVHSYYLGPGEHADRWDDPTYVDHMTKEMKAADR